MRASQTAKIKSQIYKAHGDYQCWEYHMKLWEYLLHMKKGQICPDRPVYDQVTFKPWADFIEFVLWVSGLYDQVNYEKEIIVEDYILNHTPVNDIYFVGVKFPKMELPHVAIGENGFKLEAIH